MLNLFLKTEKWMLYHTHLLDKWQNKQSCQVFRLFTNSSYESSQTWLTIWVASMGTQTHFSAFVDYTFPYFQTRLYLVD